MSRRAIARALLVCLLLQWTLLPVAYAQVLDAGPDDAVNYAITMRQAFQGQAGVSKADVTYQQLKQSAQSSTACQSIATTAEAAAQGFLKAAIPPRPTSMIQGTTCFLNVFNVRIPTTGIPLIDFFLNQLFQWVKAKLCQATTKYWTEVTQLFNTGNWRPLLNGEPVSFASPTPVTFPPPSGVNPTPFGPGVGNPGNPPPPGGGGGGGGGGGCAGTNWGDLVQYQNRPDDPFGNVDCSGGDCAYTGGFLIKSPITPISCSGYPYVVVDEVTAAQVQGGGPLTPLHYTLDPIAWANSYGGAVFSRWIRQQGAAVIFRFRTGNNNTFLNIDHGWLNLPGPVDYQTLTLARFPCDNAQGGIPIGPNGGNYEVVDNPRPGQLRPNTIYYLSVLDTKPGWPTDDGQIDAMDRMSTTFRVGPLNPPPPANPPQPCP